MKQINIEKKAVRKDSRRAVIATAFFLLIPVLFMMLWSIGVLVANIDLGPEQMHAALLAASENMEVLEALSTIAVLFGTAFTFLLFRKQGLHKQLLKKEKKMSFSLLTLLVCLVLACDYVLSAFFPIFEGLCNLVGLSPAGALEISNTIDMNAIAIISACLIAPIIEEVVFRGIAMRCLQKHSKVLALVISSTLFGLMHGNPFHAASAFCAGLIFGYVAMEYSLVWSIVLHMINNLVLCFLLPMILGANTDATMESLTLIGTIVSAVVLFARRGAIKAWIRDNMWEKPKMKWALTSVFMILMLAALCAINFMAMIPRA